MDMIHAKDLMDSVSRGNVMYDPIVELRNSIMIKLVSAAHAGFYSHLVLVECFDKHLPEDWFEQINSIFTNKGYTVARLPGGSNMITFSWPKAECS